MSIRFANSEDAETIHRFITELAEYQQQPDAVGITPEILRHHLIQNSFECLIVEENENPLGFALFCQNFHTWVGPVMWLDDIYISKEYRGRGYGKTLFQELHKIAEERGYTRIEWRVLNWNKLAIKFYEGLGASPLTEFTTWRLTKKF